MNKRKKRETALSKQSDDRGWQTLDAKIGGRVGLLELAMVSANPKAVILAELLLDPAFRQSGTKDLAKKAGMTAPEIVDLFRDKKWLETTLILHDKLPDIIDGATDDAKPNLVPCEECKASGHAESGDSCWVCSGRGTVRRPGDKDKLRFVGEAVGMTNKGGPLVQLNQQINQLGGQGTSFDDLMRKATVTVVKPKELIEGIEDAESPE